MEKGPTMNTQTSTHTENDRLRRLELRLTEAFDDLWDNYVDSRDSLYDDDGTRWSLLGSGNSPGGTSTAGPMISQHQLAEIRMQCRGLAVANEFAINAIENRISYIVGSGHRYRAVTRELPKPGERNERTEELCRRTQNFIDEFIEINNWHDRQQEIIRRGDRDGEVFLRLFTDPHGMTLVRFVEPDQVFTPADRTDDPAATLGIHCSPGDVETVRGYWIDSQWVDVDEIQHRKMNVDANVKRGLPLFYPVRKNLARAEKLLRNMSTVAQIQSAIAIIRKHASGSQASIRRFVENRAETQATDASTGKTNYLQRYAPGTILDAFAGTDYQFPAASIDAGSYVAVLQAELRAIAARLVMPEFMLSSDASNANYASTMVAEGPAVRMFQRLQHAMIQADQRIMQRAIDSAARAGRLPDDAALLVRIEAIPPSLAVRDRLREARADEILLKSGILSPQTMALRHGLDPQRESQLIGRIEQ